MHLDTPSVAVCRDVLVGRYGGNRAAGADKNEDAALVVCDGSGSWEITLLLDAHASADSAALVLSTIAAEEQVIAKLLAYPVSTAFTMLERHLITLFNSDQFRADCRTVQGETACLISVRKHQFLWWFCVGDCVVHLLHPELAAHGEFALNQRSFFEWIGQVNTFDLPVPCYSSGVKELRSGSNIILLTTDGLLQDESLPFAVPRGLYRWFAPSLVHSVETLTERIREALFRVHHAHGQDSAAVISWRVQNDEAPAQPTA